MIKVLSKTLAVLEALAIASPYPRRISELAEEFGINAATCARILRELVDAGYAVQISRQDGYAAGPRAWTFACQIRYRERLGGFVRAEQLAEVPGVRERNYEKILKQIYCDSCEIRKIDINFASPKVLGKHPYIAPQALRKLLKARQLKGGWSTAGELVEQNILTREEAARLAPYLQFGSDSGPADE